jgi:hypothetical protein
MLSAKVQSLFAVSSDGYNFNVRFGVQKLSQRLPNQSFILGDENSDSVHHHHHPQA